MFRLNVVRLHLPPLREREEDLRLLIDHFFNQFTTHFGKSVKGFTKRALDILKTYSYPGNVRELRNIIEYSVNVCQDEHIDSRHLPAYLTETPHEPKPRNEAMEAPQPMQTPPPRAAESVQGKNWAEIEKQMILDALYQAGGRRSKAAEILGWGRSTLWRKMKHYKIS